MDHSNLAPHLVGQGSHTGSSGSSFRVDLGILPIVNGNHIIPGNAGEG